MLKSILAFIMSLIVSLSGFFGNLGSFFSIEKDGDKYYETYLSEAKKNASAYDSMIYEVLTHTNIARAEKGLPALTLDSKLTEQACVRAAEMAASGVLSHTRPNGQPWSSVFDLNGFHGSRGENIAMGYTSAKEVCDGWKNSEGHYENMINRDYGYMGVGIAPCADGMGFVFVQHFFGKA